MFLHCPEKTACHFAVNFSMIVLYVNWKYLVISISEASAKSFCVFSRFSLAPLWLADSSIVGLALHPAPVPSQKELPIAHGNLPALA